MFQEILTKRLCLRRLQANDAEAIYAYRNSPELSKFLSWPQSMDVLDSTIESLAGRPFCQAPGWDQLAITRQSDGHLLGDCAVRIDEADSRIAELGIALAPEFQSKGYASETLRALFIVLFTERGVHRVFTTVDVRNRASVALMDRLGMRQEGQIKQGRWFRNEWVDDYIYGILAIEWIMRGDSA